MRRRDPLRACRALPAGLAVVAAVALAACGKAPAGAGAHLSREQLLDPGTCGGCHQSHYADWAQSVHATAADDPIFVALNAKGQRETGGALGSFCVNCHAPMAVREGATVDGLNLASVPAELKGVTCYYCHSIESVAGSHNNPLEGAKDTVMRGAFSDPVANTGHASAYSPLVDRSRLESASLCGSCHDIVSTPGDAVERTYGEWQHSAFAQVNGGSTCGTCHMPAAATLAPIAQAPGAPPRRSHGHAMPGIDVSLDPNFFAADSQRAGVQAFLDTSLQAGLCVVKRGDQAALRVVLDNVAGGHGFPSGAAQDRRTWVEIIAYSGGQVIYQSGVVADGQPATAAAATDADMWLLRQCDYAADGRQTSEFWQAATHESNALPTLATFDTADPRYYQSHVEQSFPRARAANIGAMPDRVTMRVRMRPFGLDIVDELVAGNDLDPAVRARIATFDVASPTPLLEWTAAAAGAPALSEDGAPEYCVTAAPMNLAAQRVPAPTNAGCH